MKISIAITDSAPAAYPAIYKRNLLEAVNKARDFGYDGVEWHLRRPDTTKTEEMKNTCDALNIPVTSIGTGMGCVLDGLTLVHADEDVRIQAVKRLKEFTDLAATLNSTVIIGSMKGKIPPGEKPGKYEAYLAENLNAVMDYAEKKNAPVVLEALNRYETNLLNTIDQMNDFVKRIGSNLLKVHIDTFHMNIEEADMAKSIQQCRATLGHVHFADSNRWYPGAGHIDFQRIIEALENIAYTGYIAIECMDYPEPDTAAKNAVDLLSNLLKKRLQNDKEP